MKNEKTAGSIAIARINKALNPLSGAVIPIFKVGNVAQPVSFGSAVLIELTGQQFLITNRHVIDENKVSSIYVAGRSGFVVVEGKFFSTPEADEDVAVLRLEGKLKDELAKHTFLSETNVLPVDRYDDRNHLTSVGYPATQSKEKRQTKAVRTTGYSVGANILSVAGTTIRGSFRRSRQRDAVSLKKVTAPDLHGMSGGAMFASKVTIANTDENHDPKLAGISTT